LFIWLYRRCPRVLRAITIVRPETVSLPKTPSDGLAVSGESEHDRRMIAIGLLFVPKLCDRFKSRPRLESRDGGPQRRTRPPDLFLGARARISSLVARSYAARSPRALARTIAPVMVANSSAALFGERPPVTSLSRHILKKRFTSAATSGGKSNDPAPSTVQGHIRSSECNVPRNARVHTFTGSESARSPRSINSAPSSVYG